MEFIRVDAHNIDTEHICCSLSDTKGDCGVALKKAWLKERFQEGLIFEKLNVRGKVFIEYMPAEMGWQPIKAPGYFLIDCLWVAGKYQGQGYAKALMTHAIEEAKKQGKKGLVVLSSAKKKGYLGEEKFYAHFGFQEADTWGSYFKLLYLPLSETAEKPSFMPHLKQAPMVKKTGIEIFYTHQCPFTEKYIQVLQACAKTHQLPLEVHCMADRKSAQAAPAPYTTYSVFKDGEFVTHEILTQSKFLKLAQEN